MRKLLILVVLFFVLLILSACSNKSSEILLKEEDCHKNWAVCSVINSKVINESSNRAVKIAILDSGVNSDYAALKDKVEASYNTFNNTSQTLDSLGHGTAIAGIISARPNKDNITGVLPSAKLYDVQVLDERGNGKIENVVKGIRWSIKQDIDIINISLGFQKDSELLRDAINDALKQDIIIVAAAGNTFGMSTDYPAKYPGVLSISAVDQELASYSLAATGKIDFVAPGVNIPIIGKINDNNIVSGTSFATAYATSVIGYHLSNSNNTNILSSDVIEVKNLGNKKYNGNGILYIP